MQDELQLIERLKQRDPDAFAAVFNQHSDRLYRLALGILKNGTEAEGVVQDTFVRLIENLDSFEGRSSLGTWLYRVAYNTAVDRWRKWRPTRQLVEEYDDSEDLPTPTVYLDWTHAPEDLLESAEVRAYLSEAVDALPEPLYSVFTLRELEGLSTAETSDVLGISEANVKVRLHRARLALRESLAVYFDELLNKETQ